MKVIFMGTPEFALPVLQGLIDHHQVVCVYTRAPKPCGKGLKLTPSPIHLLAQEHGLLVRTPKTLKDPVEQGAFADLQADVAIVCAYGLILPQPILDAPRLGCINVHASLLPRWRGAAPIQRAVMAGDKQTGITIMQMDAGLDTGDMLSHATVDITPTMTGGQLHDILSELGERLLLQTLQKPLIPVKQPGTGDTYAMKIDKTESLLDFHLPADVLERKIRAFNPYPKTYFTYKNERIMVLGATLGNTSSLPAGTVDNTGAVVCGDGRLLHLTFLQRQGKKVLPITEFLKGFSFQTGDNLCAIV